MKVLVIGSGGREHAICKKLATSPKVSTVYCAKGNEGMQQDGIQLVDIEENNHAALIEFAKKERINWTFVGPEAPLMNGIVDDFLAAGLKIFGPTKKAALIEGSKDFAKQLMTTYQIPTAAYQTFTDYEQALCYVEEKGTPIVIKADGLAAGKGVVVAEDMNVATLALKDMLLDGKFSGAEKRVVIEEFLSGEEFSLLAFVSNNKIYPMPIAQDHKRAYEGDKGPNTGGMGAYSPVPQIPESMIEEAVEKVLKPAVQGMRSEEREFTGILYAGLIASEKGVKVIEFNARFGDPETQVVLNRLTSDFAQLIDDLLNNQVPVVEWQKKGYDIGIVIASDGYPDAYQKEIILPDLTKLEEVQVYYAGVKKNKTGNLVSNGGRIYLIEAQGDTLKEAADKAYQQLKAVDTEGTFYRMDIGKKVMKQN
ncbi:phosphoribosylamine--glycine ligase [Carnobacterium divergens]|uniref:phosphoribosylamine--glycine ligase n=1 Tax=Carnobacterium divergens TaxID=2748 RepID=UPI001071DB62|nr:phosphoribosylamine--glycine ligase [Carnobacterium divergens]MDT1995876.1 phosphoribosylamine--glycine ligase [Carnobacterium divergens]TFI68494.1 phosphoribosylamine--glycine ligase [Carnobacterium divergens]TFI68691.1 phosphoribosylamine--glycine ligase [Carnobacterium divergens]TFI72599.1 phosphoribosylamine--glycine ligase [Carnobacterium divergens]TFI83684.1 phosphoribosylamine--glycine ligase [Carnobacterium divergens]